MEQADGPRGSNYDMGERDCHGGLRFRFVRRVAHREVKVREANPSPTERHEAPGRARREARVNSFDTASIRRAVATVFRRTADISGVREKEGSRHHRVNRNVTAFL